MTTRTALSSHRDLLAWISEWESICKPERVLWCDGSAGEYQEICELLVKSGTFATLSPSRRPRSYVARSDPGDVARVEDRTFICSENESDAGPTNNWVKPSDMKETLLSLFSGCMRGRTMYVLPYAMGPIGSQAVRIGVQLTDSAYVVTNMALMTRMGTSAANELGDRGAFVRCVHSVGSPLQPGQEDSHWPCDPHNKYIAHFPEGREIWSYGSGYGGNALLAKKCFALRIASVIARDEGWLAEHMLIIKVTSPKGQARFMCGAFPSACGKTNLAMLASTIPGWKVQTIGDDIAWIRIGSDGRLRAVNPEAGFFGVAPGTSTATNPNATAMLCHDTIFTNTASTDDGDVWWEGLSETPPPGLTDWRGQTWEAGDGKTAAHPNARFTVAAGQAPCIAPEWQDPEGVPISAVLFGGRRSGLVPLVTEARSWSQGVFLASTMASETTAAQAGRVGVLRRDPFAMLPFCGYDMASYLQHWLNMGHSTTPSLLPRLYLVNWFRRDPGGAFLWPGFGENSRVLRWIFERCDERAVARDAAIGYLPEDLDLDGLQVDPGPLLAVDRREWLAELESVEGYYAELGDRLPGLLLTEIEDLRERLSLERGSSRSLK